jgi:hypothetical protein
MNYIPSSPKDSFNKISFEKQPIAPENPNLVTSHTFEKMESFFRSLISDVVSN